MIKPILHSISKDFSKERYNTYAQSCNLIFGIGKVVSKYYDIQNSSIVLKETVLLTNLSVYITFIIINNDYKQ